MDSVTEKEVLKFTDKIYQKGYNKGYADGAKGEWHSTTEGQPINAGEYFVTFFDESGKYADMIEVVDKAYWTGLKWELDCDELEFVLAWRPVFNPYIPTDEEVAYIKGEVE